VNTSKKDLAAEVKALTDGKGADVALDTVGGPMFEPVLKSLAVGGRQVAINSAVKRSVEFDLVDFYHNALRLIGLDTMKLTGPGIAKIMDALRAGFESGELKPSEIAAWPLDKAGRRLRRDRKRRHASQASSPAAEGLIDCSNFAAAGGRR